MKNPLIHLVTSGVALGLMCGAVAIHALHVRGAQDLAQTGSWVSESEEVAFEGSRSAIVPTALGVGRTAPRPAGAPTDAATLQALNEIVERLQELKSENQNLQGVNKELQDQLEETNRDLSELQFRVDTHSQSFRPLRFTTDAASILEGSISPGSTMQPLLLPQKEELK